VLQASDVLFSEVLDRLARIPGVESVGLTSMLPPNSGAAFPVTVVGHPDVENAIAPYQEVSPAFFDTMRIPLVRGRVFTDLDRGSAPAVAIINETAALEWFRGEEPLGQTILIPFNQNNPELEQDRPRQIVGVVEDSRLRLQDDPVPIVYTPYLQHIYHYAGTGPGYPNYHKVFVIRTAAGAPNLSAEVRAAVDEVDPVVAVDQMIPMRARLSQSASNEQFLMRLLGTFAVLGIFLAAMGIYGVISYSVMQRRHEFGIRTALGAAKRDILWIVVREALTVTALGTLVGILGAFWLTRYIQSALYEVTPMDPVTIAAVALLLFAVAILASWVPGRQAGRQSPLIALRTD
jgi:putative ABC transport system permease protein